MNSTQKMLEIILLALQAYMVIFLWMHDWVPLGRFNDVAAVRSQDTWLRLAVVTLVQSLPFTVAFIFSAHYFGQSYPRWLDHALLIFYGVCVVAYLRAWWIPYFAGADAKKVERYRIMFGNTHSILPLRHGIVVNTAHLLLHLATVAALIVLWRMM